MGNSSSSSSYNIPPMASSSSILLMLSDGTLQNLPSPIPASHLHLNPNFLLCDSSTLRVGSRPSPLRPDSLLLQGRLYILLPLPAFQRRLSSPYLSSIIATFASSHRHLRRPNRRSRTRRALPCSFRRTGLANVCDSCEALSRYIDQLIDRSNSWKPKLETIDEISASAKYPLAIKRH